MSYPKLIKSNGVSSIIFDSLDELLRYANDSTAGNCPEAVVRGNQCVNGDGMSKEWLNYKTMSILQAELASPSAELTEALAVARDQIEAHIAAPKQRRRKRRSHLEAGDELNEDAWVMRELDGWSDTVRELREKRTITIAVNTVVHTDRRPEDLIWRGACAAALADILSERGHSVEIVGFWSVNNLSRSEQRFALEYVIKDSSMPMDIASAALATAEIGFVRLAVHAAAARSCTRKPTDFLGTPAPLHPEVARTFDVLIEQHVTTLEQAVAVVLRHMGSEAN